MPPVEGIWAGCVRVQQCMRKEAPMRLSVWGRVGAFHASLAGLGIFVSLAFSIV